MVDRSEGRAFVLEVAIERGTAHSYLLRHGLSICDAAVLVWQKVGFDQAAQIATLKEFLIQCIWLLGEHAEGIGTGTRERECRASPN